MNVIIISLKNLRQLISKHLIVLVIMIIALSVSTVTFLYVTVKLDSYSDNISENDLNLSQIYLDDTKKSLDVDEVKAKLSDYCKNNDKVDYAYAFVESDEINSICVLYNEKSVLNNFSKNNKAIEGRFFTEEEIENGENVIISVGMGTDKKSVIIDDIEYDVIGCYGKNGITNGYIPLNTVLNNGIYPLRYVIQYKDKLSISQIKLNKTELQNILPQVKIMTNLDHYAEEAPLSLDFENVCLVLMAMVSILSCVFLYLFLIQMRINQMNIFKICGATTFQLLKIYVFELLILLATQFLFAFVIFRLVLVSALKKYDIAFMYSYSFRQMLFTMLVITAVALLIFTPLIIFYCKKNAVEMKAYQKG